MKRIIISRTDNLGDVILTLPIATALKQKFPGASIIFIGKKYTEGVIQCCTSVDIFLDRETVISEPSVLRDLKADAIIFVYPDKALAKAVSKAGIPLRIGTSHRWYHWLYCNKLINFSRNKSQLHEALLNFKLLAPFGINLPFSTKSIPALYHLRPFFSLKETTALLLQNNKKKFIIHPKSKGSAREWPLESYHALVKSLPEDKYQWYITGTEAEGASIRQQYQALTLLPNVVDVTGTMSLPELISFIGKMDGLVACSTGPLHIAAALGKYTIGIYPPIKPMNLERWGAIGERVELFALKKNCSDCRKTNKCHCIESIHHEVIAKAIHTDYAS